jgi:hypothetical protein
LRWANLHPLKQLSYLNIIRNIYHYKSVSSFTFAEFTADLAFCKNIGYIASLIDGSSLPSFIKFTPGIRIISVYTTDAEYVGNYIVLITGAIGSYGSASLTFTVSIV